MFTRMQAMREPREAFAPLQLFVGAKLLFGLFGR
jgi:hypothetical protein